MQDSTRSLVERRIAQSRQQSGSSSGSMMTLALVCFIGAPLMVLALQQRQPDEGRPVRIITSVNPLESLARGPAPAVLPADGAGVSAVFRQAAAAGDAAIPSATMVSAAQCVGSSQHVCLEHESDHAMAVLNRERAKVGGANFAHAFHIYRPPEGHLHPGGDMDDPATLRRAVAAAAADGEVMLLCIGGSGSMRAGMNLVMNFRTMGLYHMLILATEKDVCKNLWGVLPSLACVWWPSQFSVAKPKSLYNTMFSNIALAFFETRKVLLERLVLTHQLNVLHLDADTVWFANPYPYFKTLYKDYSLIIQTDNPFANAGILYVQNVREGDTAAWVLQELNRRIWRFTYRPESVKELPNSGWSTAPHFANADEQANLNDILTSSLIGKQTYAAGVEFYEARFKRDKGDAHARGLMASGSWTTRMSQGDVSPARSHLTSLRPDQAYESLVHLCKPSLWVGVSTASLSVPQNATAARSKLLLAPEWLFSHFPYGAFFPSFRECHSDRWQYATRSTVEQRLCMPTFRVPVVMVHMAGLRNGQWGRRGVMRALGVWHEAADRVATAEWVSVQSPRYLVVDGAFISGFTSMRQFDWFCARLILLATLLGRRAVIPSMPCTMRWVRVTNARTRRPVGSHVHACIYRCMYTHRETIC